MKRSSWVPTIIGAVFVVVVVSYFWMTTQKPVIEEGKVYKLGYTYLVDLEGVRDHEGRVQTVKARMFDFSDRNLPERSIVVPLWDANGISLIEQNRSLPTNTVRKIRIMVAGRTIEGIEYPSYQFVRWEYNPGTTEAQSVVPKMKPRS